MSQTYTTEDKLKVVERELKYRRRVYAGLVVRGKMKQAAADEQIAVFEAIAADYRVMSEGERLI